MRCINPFPYVPNHIQGAKGPAPKGNDPTGATEGNPSFSPTRLANDLLVLLLQEAGFFDEPPAANSHSASVGKRFPINRQCLSALTQSTPIAGQVEQVFPVI